MAFTGGGARQLAAAVAAGAATGTPQSSVLIDRLLSLFGWGLISAATCQWLAEGACEDGLIIDAVTKMSGIGTSGAHSGNCRRDLLRAFCSDMVVAKPIEMEVPMMSKRKIVSPRTCSMSSPTLMFERAFHNYKNVFAHMMTRISPRKCWDKLIRAIQSLQLLDPISWRKAIGRTEQFHTCSMVAGQLSQPRMGIAC